MVRQITSTPGENYQLNPMKQLSRVNDYIEPMVTFTAWAKTYSMH